VDSEKKDAFFQRLVDVLNGGALNLAMAIGYRTRLFDVMAEYESPEPLEILALRAGLSPRYVREWLGVMVTGRVVDLCVGPDGAPRYFLPPEHAAFLTRASGSDNLAVYTQEIPLLTTCAMEPVVSGFQTGQGVSYDHYPRFQAFMTELSNAKHRQVLIDQFLPTVDDGRIVAALESGIRVCDIGCGEGVAPLLMAEAFPRSRFVGMDMDPAVVGIAKRAAQDRGLGNIDFQVADVADLLSVPSLADSFDYVTAFDAIHDQTRPLKALRGVWHILKPGGRFSMIDIASQSAHAGNMDHPMGPFLYTVSLMHCMPVGLVDGGDGLGMMWGREQALDLLQRAGFTDAQVIEMARDRFNYHYFCIKRT